MASIFEIVDRAHDGQLAERLRSFRAEGKSIEEMTAALAADGYRVSRETVRRWCREAGVPTHRVPAAVGATSSPAGRANGDHPPDTASAPEGPAGGGRP